MRKERASYKDTSMYLLWVLLNVYWLTRDSLFSVRTIDKQNAFRYDGSMNNTTIHINNPRNFKALRAIEPQRVVWYAVYGERDHLLSCGFGTAADVSRHILSIKQARRAVLELR